MVSVNAYLEEILTRVSISPTREAYVRDVVEKVFRALQGGAIPIHNYRFGGSFNRYTGLRNYFDIDVYFIGEFPQSYFIGSFTTLLQDLEHTCAPFCIARPPPYLHAIPATYNNDVEIDCLAALDFHNGVFLIPEGNSFCYCYPSRTEDQLRDLNTRSSGLGTKVIRLLKLWNSLNNKPLRSFQLESLIYKIFASSYISSLDAALSFFFKQSIPFLRSGEWVVEAGGWRDVLQGLDRRKVIDYLQNACELSDRDAWTKIFPTI